MTTVIERRAQNPEAVLFICDFSPPRGPDAQLFEQIRALDADFISVAYNPGKSPRVNAAFAARWIRERLGKEVLFTLATRDMNKLAAQSLLLGAALLDLENVVVIQGDRFTAKELEAVSAVDDFTPTALLRSVVALNDGRDYKGGTLRTPTRLCVGAAIDLGRDVKREIALTRRKAEAGAQFFLLQALFDPPRLRDFSARYGDTYGEALSPPVFCGVSVLTQDSIVFGDRPDWVTADLAKGRPGDEIAATLAQRFVEQGDRSIYLIPPILRGGRRDYRAAQRVIEAFRR